LATSAELDLALRADLKESRPFLLKRFIFFRDKIIQKKEISQPPRPGNKLCKNQIINCPGAFLVAWLLPEIAHRAISLRSAPFKRRGKYYNPAILTLKPVCFY
jgi:hypothetical protein